MKHYHYIVILNKNDYNALILMLTTKDTTDDKIIGLDPGADDYLVKLFRLTN